MNKKLHDLIDEYRKKDSNELEKHLTVYDHLDLKKPDDAMHIIKGCLYMSGQGDVKTTDNLWASPHPHQRRIRNKLAEQYAQKLTKLTKNNFKNFEELYDELTSENIGFPKGCAMSYDVALRIGHRYGIAPKDYVYLHNGVKVGAIAMRDKGYITLPKGYRVPIDTFSKSLPGLSAADIEIFLCTNKKEIRNL